MKKKLISLLTALSMTFMLFTGVPISVSAEEVASGGCGSDGVTDTTSNVKWSLDDSGVLTISGTGNMNNWTSSTLVPWYSSRDTMTNVVIENGVTSIGNNAFNGCSDLKSVTIPYGVTSIGMLAFYGCSNLTSVIIPDSVTEIGQQAFRSCSSLTSVTIPNSVTSIGNYVFDGCSNLEIIVLRSEAYNRNSNIPSTTTRIEYSVDNGKHNVTNIVLGSGKTSVTVTDDMGIDFVEKNQRTKVAESGHTHKGGTATCIAKAKCDICDTEHGSLAEHTEVTDEAVEPNCTTEGKTAGSHCDVCGEVLTAQTIVSAKGHSYGSWTIKNAPTLTSAGTADRVCSNDSSHTETKDVPVLSANIWTKSETTKPTIDTDGSYTYTSTEYGNVTVTVPKLTDSSWTKAETKKPTVDENGEYTYTSGYGEVKATVPNLKDSVWTKTETTKPTVDTNGEYIYTSEAYGNVTVTVPKLSDNTVWTNTEHIDPTETTTGKDVYTSDYGVVEVELPAKEHTHTYFEEWSKDEAYHWHAATCVHTDEIKDKGAHTGGTATCSAKAVCEICGNGYGEYEPDNHNFVGGKCEDCQTVDPDHTHIGGTATCENKAVCEICKQEYGNLAEHSFTNGTCVNCGAVDPTYIPPHEHTFVDGKCECGETDPNCVPPHNHTFVGGVCECGEIDPNYVSPHKHTFVDGVCDCGETDPNYVPPHNHTFVDGVCDCGAIDPTYNPSGSITGDVNDTAGTNAEFALIENVLTPEDKAEAANGSSFKIVLEVTDIRNSVSPADVAVASSALNSGEEIGVYVDLSLYKIKDGAEKTPIHNANGQIGITLTIPESIFSSNRTYSMIRVHNGIAENLGGTYDKATRSLTFYTDKFSTYAIAFTASSVNDNSPTIPSRPSIPTTGGTTPSTPSVPAVTPTVTETAAKTEEEIISDDEPYVEDVSSGAGVTEDSESIDLSGNVYSFLSLILILGIGFIYFKKSRQK